MMHGQTQISLQKVDNSMRRNTEHSENDKGVSLIKLWHTKNFQNFPYQFLLTSN
jgi:hypothetical protein